MNKDSIQIKFEGQGHQIDANTLVNTLIHYTALITEINTLYGGDTRKINVKVNAIEKGSFIIDVALQDTILAKIFSGDSVNYIAGLVTITAGVYGLFKKNKGKKESRDGEITVGNLNIDKKTIINIYNQPIIREIISKSIDTVDNDTAVDGFKISSKEETVSFSKKDFSELINIDFSEEDTLQPLETIDIIEDATLGIVKLTFEKGRSWEFIYQGFKISIPMKDSNFYDSINSGARFAKGDSLVVRLEILKRFNSDYDLYENKGYRILEVKQHISRPQEPSFFN